VANFKGCKGILLKKIIFLCFLLVGSGVFAQPVALDQAVRDSGIPSDSLSVVLWRVGDSSPRYDLNGGVARTPASLMKLVTSWAALSSLGPAHTWRTEFRAEPVAPGVVGNLYWVGMGDPWFTLEDLGDMLRSLRLRGVKRISGDLVLAPNRFPPAPGSLQDGQPWRAYNVVPDSLMLGFQALTWSLQAEHGQVLAIPNFDLPGVRLENHLKVVSGECSLDWKSRISKKTEDNGQEAKVILSGPFPASCEDKTLAFKVLDNEHFLGNAFRKIWAELGGEFQGGVRRADAAPGANTLALHNSPALAQILVAMNKESNNPMARTLYLDLGCSAEGVCSNQASSARVRELLLAAGLDLPELVMENGSGLSLNARISALGLAQILNRANSGPWAPEFKSSLPLYGLDGTLKNKGQNSPWVGRFRLKGGTIDGVRGLAGYGLAQNGQEYILVLIANHKNAAQTDALATAVMEWVYLQQ
jgi:D-alanyl-D-alanine carboxypeptidase/D-alanyl-D-alanine-endopeptidase (penicillin-binding protein 4)